MEITQNRLSDQKFLVVKKFLDAKAAKQMAFHFREFAGAHGVGDEQVPNCLSVYNYLPFVRMLIDKLPQCEALSGLKLLPTYTYARHYNKVGTTLMRHTDRPSCEISVTVNLDKTEDWPIYMESSDGLDTAVELEPGDAVMYLGCDVPHWREEYTGADHVQVFMHYVDAYGPHAERFFDTQDLMERS